MCNTGRYVERNHGMRAAGISTDCSFKASDTLMHYPEAELAEVWFKSKCPKPPVCDFFPTSSILPNDTLQDVLAPELSKSRFAKFKEQFFEDLYLKKPELGKTRQVNSIPEDITNENTVFGIKTQIKEDLYGLVLPRKSVAEVNHEYIDWHDKYVISHQHYLPSERIHRNYNNHFNSKNIFGMSIFPDKSGRRVKLCLTDKNQNHIVKNLQKYYLERSFGEIGTKISKFNDPHLQDRSRVYGSPPKPYSCSLREIVHNIDPCVQDDELLKAVAYLSRQRARLQHNASFDVYDLEIKLAKLDPDKTGYVPLHKAVIEARTLDIYLNERLMRDALIFYKLIEDVGLPTERIKIENFSKSLQIRFLLPEIAFKRATGEHDLDTTYRELCRDLGKPAPPVIPHFKKLVVIEDSSSEEEFAMPREKGQVKRIFSKIVCSDTFERIWEIAKQKFNIQDDMMSINQFRAEMKLLQEMQKKSDI